VTLWWPFALLHPNGESMSDPLTQNTERRIALQCTAALGLALMSAACIAAPEEIQVYLDDRTEPGHFGTDLHNVFVISGGSTPDYEGAIAPEHVYRFTPEIYYGMSNILELGVYLLTTASPELGTRCDGEKIRAKYIAPHDEDHGPFWGANLEIGKTSIRVSVVPWTAELKGI